MLPTISRGKCDGKLAFTLLFTIFDCSRKREQFIIMSNDQEIAQEAILKLQDATGFKADWQADKLLLKAEGQTYIWTAEVRKGLRNIHVPMLEQTAAQKQPVAVITDYLYPALRETLRKAGIGYMDGAGNIYLKIKGQLIFVDGKQPGKKEKLMQVKNRAFTKTGLPLVFDILQKDEWLNKTQRELADLYQMALGNVHNIFKNLQDGGYLLQTGNNRNRRYRLLDKKKLLEEWIIAYAETLKPALFVAGYRFLKNEDLDEWQKVTLKKGKTFWGGEPAGDLLTNYLKPAIFTLYTTEEKNELVRNYRLVPDINGNIAVYNKFWHYDEDNKNNTAPPLLVYADLMNTGDARCMETAQRIYDGSLKDKF